jgi:DNA-binding NarL/FixJ family response regulator
MTAALAPRVLLADDEAGMRRSLRYLLEAEGLVVVGEAEDGGQAVTLACELAPDVVLMDVRMPVLNGLEATRQVRRLLPGTQVVIFTAYDEPGLERQALGAGAFACLAKGGDGDELVDLLVRACQAPAGGARRHGRQPAAPVHGSSPSGR